MSEINWNDIAEKFLVEELGIFATGYDVDTDKESRKLIAAFSKKLVMAYQEGLGEAETRPAQAITSAIPPLVNIALSIPEARAVFTVLSAVRVAKPPANGVIEYDLLRSIWKADDILEKVENGKQ